MLIFGDPYVARRPNFLSFAAKRKPMGITIHFEGALNGETAMGAVLKTAKRYCKSRNRPYAKINAAEVTLRRVRGEQDWDYNGHIQ